MKTLVQALATLAALSDAAPGVAAERISDAQYVNAARCQGLMRAARVDSASVDQYLRRHGSGRSDLALARARPQRQEAEHDGRKNDDAVKQRLNAERAAKCAKFASSTVAGTAATGGH